MRSTALRWSLLGAILIASAVYRGAGLVRVVRASGEALDHTVFSAHLPNVPGKTLTAIVVEYGPGGGSPAHRHAGSVFAYVLSGQIRSENSATGPVRVYRAQQFARAAGAHVIASVLPRDRDEALRLGGKACRELWTP